MKLESNLILADQITPSLISIEVRRGKASHVQIFHLPQQGAFNLFQIKESYYGILIICEILLIS